LAGAKSTTGAATTLVVAAKLLVPEVRPETVARARLTRLLTAKTRSSLTVVSAPAGYGKTTALADWLATTGRPCAWVSLDARDNDPRRLWAHVLAALDRPLPGVMDQAHRALLAGSDVLDTVVDLTANALTDHASDGLTLVLDDCHVLEEDSCHRLLGALVDAAPSGVQVVVSGRAKPPLRLARRRAGGTLAEIGAEELRFRREETERLLNGSLALGLEPGVVGAIDDRVQGWAAGLALAASSLRERSEPEEVLDGLAAPNGEVAQYLTEEVLDGMDPALRDFLRQTSILGRLSPPLCEAVLDDPSAPDVLAEVRRSNVFATALEDEGEWLSYHPLFRELLERELGEESPRLVRDLHLRASAWFAANAAPEEAIGHASAAGDGEQAAELLCEHQRAFLLERRYEDVRRILAGLPTERGAFAGFCEALETLCMALEGADLRLVAQRLDALEDMRDAPGVAELVDRMRVSPYYGDVRRAAEAGWALWERYADQPGMRAWIAGQFGIVLWFAGEPGEARDVLEPLVGEIERATGRVWALSALALAAADDGDSDLAERYGRAAVELAEDSGAESALESHVAYVALGEAQRLRGALDEADVWLAQAAHLTGELPGSMYQALTLVFQAQVAFAARDRRNARAHAAAARRIVDRYPDSGTLAERLASVEAALERRSDDALLGSQPTPAELRLLALLPSDLTLREIASEHLYVSIHTVTSHARRLYRRLGARTRAEAVAAARERGLL
jgi:LuxR family transcriptional regulator, maltose regulon positive regulatory protein